jgi:hypothetical protein
MLTCAVREGFHRGDGVPEADGVILARGDQLFAIAREAGTRDAVLMSRARMDFFPARQLPMAEDGPEPPIRAG